MEQNINLLITVPCTMLTMQYAAAVQIQSFHLLAIQYMQCGNVPNPKERLCALLPGKQSPVNSKLCMSEMMLGIFLALPEPARHWR